MPRRARGNRATRSHEGPSHMDRITRHRRQAAQGHDPDLRRQERRPAADDRQPAHRRPAHPQERAEPRRRQPAGAHPAQPRRRPSPSTASAPIPPAHIGETFHLSARDIVDTTAPYELVSRMRASFWVLGPAARPLRPGARFAARRLRHRHAPGRPAPHGAQGARRRDRHRRRLCGRQGARAASGAAASSSPRSRSAPPTTC